MSPSIFNFIKDGSKLGVTSHVLDTGVYALSLTSVVAAFADEKSKAEDVDENDEDARGLADVVGQGQDDHDEELSRMADLLEEGEEDDEEVTTGRKVFSLMRNGKKSGMCAGRFKSTSTKRTSTPDTEAASAGVTDAQRADLKDWTDSCVM